MQAQAITLFGTIHAILHRGPQVVMFVLATDEKYSSNIVIKKFREKDETRENFQTEGQFIDYWAQAAVGEYVVVMDCRISTERAKRPGGADILTDSGDLVYNTFVRANVVERTMRAPKPVQVPSAPPPAKPASSPAPASPQPAPPRRPALVSQPPQSAPVQTNPAELDDIPAIPFI